MSEGQHVAVGGSGAARFVALMALTVLAVIGLVGMFAAVGVMRVVRDQASSRPKSESPVATTARPADAVMPQVAPAQTSPPEAVATNVADVPMKVPPPAGPVAPAAQAATAALIRVEDRGGDWVGRYGTQGYQLAIEGGVPHLPPGVRMSIEGARSYDWSPVTTDPRGLNLPGDPSQRVAGQWFAWDRFSVDLDLRDAWAGRQVALYLLDWDSDERVQRLDVLDAGSGELLISRKDENFRGGRFVILKLSGHVVLRITKLGGANCTLSGVFFDPLPPEK